MRPGTGFGPRPERIGRYRILERIGKGAMGVIYSAHDEVMDRVVALKVMMADLEGEPETRTRFYREAQAAGRLLHPNIITIFDMGEEEGHIYIVMELLRGETLGESLKRPGATSLEQKVSMMTQVCDGLGAAHAHGIFHRDVKPSNLFVQPDGSVKILDFGVARLSSSTMTASGFIIGTPDYMSPEQARGAEIDHRSDIFSAAAVFYFMLSGVKPFAGPDLPAVLKKVQVVDPPPLPEGEVPGPLARIVMKSLAKDPALRHQAMADFAGDLAKFRRYYEAETRQIAATARERYAAIESLVEERAALSDWLGLPPAEEEPAVARRLRETHRSFVQQGQDALLLVPFTRPQVAEIAAALGAEHQPLSRTVSRLREARAALEAAGQALDNGRADAALARLDATAGLASESTRARGLRERARRALAARQARETQLAALATEARAAIDAKHWAVAVALADEALLGDPQAAEFAAIRARAREAMGREAQVRAREQRWALDRARKAIGERRFELAEQEIGRARQFEADADSLGAIERLLAEARHAAAAEAAARERERRQRENARATQHDLRSARQALRAEHADAAESAAARILARDPGDRTAVALIEEIAALRTRLKAAEREAEDETVGLEAQAASDDDTVAMPSPARPAEPLVVRLGSRLKTILRGRN
jgi:serine/threonine-protein kinase